MCFYLEKATCDSVKCSDGQSCLRESMTGNPRCVTCSRPRWCKKYQRNQMEGPICATSGKSYKNWCEMMDDTCLTGIALDTKHLGECKTRDLENNNGLRIE